MNRYCYRIIFNKSRGQLMVVPDIATANTQGSDQRRVQSTTTRLWVTLRRSIFCFSLLFAASYAGANNIAADPNADRNRQPEVIQTHNGIPQVNIRAPNASGLSHNEYQRFDVDQRGVILNNSALTTNTQLAGYIQGNANLNPNGPAARVILNEVNSNKPSELRGFMEVAGSKAQVIVANPSGILCDGCGTINAGRMTLTTGKPQLNADGSLAGYQVERGTIRIQGGGLNGDSRHDTEYADIMARAIEVNAGIWAKESVSVVAGRNRISADGQEVTALSSASDPGTPKMAIDMGQMGGMYSGKIRMIGTEAGMGVRNSGGHINAGKTLTITSEGNLEWITAGDKSEPCTTAGGDITLAAREDIQHDGKLHTQGNLNIQSRTGSIRQSGTLAATGAVDIRSAADIRADGHILAGSNQNSELVARRDLTLKSDSGQVSAHGNLLTQGTATLEGKSLDLSRSRLRAEQASLTASEGASDLTQAHIDTQQLTLSSKGVLSTQEAAVRAAQWQVSADSLYNRGGVWSQVGSTLSVLDINTLLDNSGGVIEARDLALSAGALDNSGGRLVALGNGVQQWSVDTLLNNSGGVLGSNSDLLLSAGAVDNLQGTLQSRGHLTLTLQQQLDNRRGRLLSGGDLLLNA
ncbi:MAG: filamentous hemagglutinin N-terminal domain-containing protein, partial [Enterobacteriaceae bacterium]